MSARLLSYLRLLPLLLPLAGGLATRAEEPTRVVAAVGAKVEQQGDRREVSAAVMVGAQQGDTTVAAGIAGSVIDRGDTLPGLATVAVAAGVSQQVNPNAAARPDTGKPESSIDASVVLVEHDTSASVEVWKDEISTGWGNPTASMELKATGALLEATSGSATSVKVEDGNLVASTSGSAALNLVSNSIELGGTQELAPGVDINSQVKGELQVGIEGSGEMTASVGTDGASLAGSAEVFAGGKLSGSMSGGMDLDFLGISLSGVAQGELTAGIGGKAGGIFSLEGGKLTLGFGLSGTLGLGAGGNVAVTLDASQLLGKLAGVPQVPSESEQVRNQADTIVNGVLKAIQEGRYEIPAGQSAESVLANLQREANAWASDPGAYVASHGGGPAITSIVNNSGLARPDATAATDLPGPGSFGGGSSGGAGASGSVKLEAFR